MTIQEAIERLKRWSIVQRRMVKMTERAEMDRLRNVDTYDMACEALEKQIPKKTLPTSDDIFEFGNCPNCGAEFNSELIGEYEIQYCPYCGQALDWSQENKPIDEPTTNIPNSNRWNETV